MPRPSSFEHLAVAALFAAFLGTALLWSDHSWYVAVPGMLTVSAAWLLAQRLGPAAHGREMLGVTGAAMMMLALPSAFHPPIHLDTWVAVVLGVLATEAAWAVWRFPETTPLPPMPLTTALRESLTVAFGMAVAYTLVATAIVLVASNSGHAPRGADDFLITVIAGYFVGGLLAGTVIGLLRRLTASPLGAMFVGVLAGICVYGAVSPAVAFADASEGQPASPPAEQIGIAIACGLLAGPPAAILIRAKA